MSLAFCIYNLTIDIENSLNAFVRIAEYFDLSAEPVLVQIFDPEREREIPLRRVRMVHSLFSKVDNFLFSVAAGDRLPATHYNSAPYVCYSRLSKGDSITALSTADIDLRDFAERFLGTTPGKYGFGMDWNRFTAFSGYVYGFKTSEPLGSGHAKKSDAARWGSIFFYYSEPDFFDRGLIRDIYPVNLFTTAQLDRETRGGTVRDLILAHADWGRIATLADNWFMWCVPPEQIENVRAAFEARGLLTNRKADDIR